MIGMTNANPLVPQWGGTLVEQVYDWKVTNTWALRGTVQLPNDGGWYYVEVREGYWNAQPQYIAIKCGNGCEAASEIIIDAPNDIWIAQCGCLCKAGSAVNVYSKAYSAGSNVTNGFYIRYVKVSN